VQDSLRGVPWHDPTLKPLDEVVKVASRSRIVLAGSCFGKEWYHQKVLDELSIEVRKTHEEYTANAFHILHHQSNLFHCPLISLMIRK
jgi:hypothetical protein